jgi:hypothetical protein
VGRARGRGLLTGSGCKGPARSVGSAQRDTRRMRAAPTSHQDRTRTFTWCGPYSLRVNT